ncbi:MAG: TrmB family transcriptional regulator [Acidimicrobiales bacterium]
MPGKDREAAARHLEALGMTTWEARAYLTLADEAPLSGYAVAKSSGVPRSKVYEVLSSLVSSGAVHVARSDPLLYGALPPKELIDRMRAENDQRCNAAQAAMADYAAQVGGNAVIWDIEGRTDILARARQLVRSAQHRILIEIWEPDAVELRDDLADVAGRGVEIFAVAYGEPNFPFAQVYSHPLTDEVTSGLGGRWLVLSVDNREVVAGIVSSGRSSRAAWTSHPGLVVPITELVAHDIYKLELLASHGDILEAHFGPGLSKLRARFAYAAQRLDRVTDFQDSD